MSKALSICIAVICMLSSSYSKEVTIIFIRHAESIGNYFAYVDPYNLPEYLGQTRETPTEQTVLTSLGNMQAAKCGDNLRDLIVRNGAHIYGIYSSTYVRAKQTASIIASKCIFGERENSGTLLPDVDILPDIHHTLTLPNGTREPREQVLARTRWVVSGFVRDRRQTGGTYIIVGHADPWRWYFSHLDPTLIFDQDNKLGNCSVTIITYPDDGPPEILVTNVGLDQWPLTLNLPNKI